MPTALAQGVQKIVSLSALALALCAAAPASANDRILLSEILPALAGSEIGLLEIGDAPPPGATRVVRRSEVVQALRRAGRSTSGLAIPRVTRVRRDARVLERDAIVELARPALREALAPCAIEDISAPREVRVAGGRLAVTADAEAPRASGSVGAMLVLDAGGREQRIPVRARVSCPAPVVSAGAPVRIVVTVGNVRASAPGVARQPGRRGDIIRVQGATNRRTFEARVLDSETVEIVR